MENEPDAKAELLQMISQLSAQDIEKLNDFLLGMEAQESLQKTNIKTKRGSQQTKNKDC